MIFRIRGKNEKGYILKEKRNFKLKINKRKIHDVIKTNLLGPNLPRVK